MIFTFYFIFILDGTLVCDFLPLFFSIFLQLSIEILNVNAPKGFK